MIRPTMLLKTERDSTKEESHHEAKVSRKSRILNHQRYEASKTRLDLEECVDDPAASVEPTTKGIHLHSQSEMEAQHQQVASEGNYEGYRRGSSHCKKFIKDVTKTHISRPEIIKDKSKPHANVEMPKKKIHGVGSEEVLSATSPSHLPSTTHAGVTMGSVNRQDPMLVATPEWRPHKLIQARPVRTTTVVTGVLAVVLTLVCLVWYVKTRKRKGKIVSLGRRGVSVGAWDERAEEAMIVCEGGEYRD